MSDVAVRVEDLGKRFRIGERAHHKTVRETFGALVRAPFAAIAGRPTQPIFSRNRDSTHFWALRHVSFELRQGEILGIVGNNGAGKTTLLKILSRITEPTEGSADIRGRVRSLLEVGTGFHPELTGRENVYLNGAILGMKRAEIARKFDTIVEFAGVDRFIDTPVKWYSSGMYMRLAFSVAAHLEPDVLIVDEVLAVGDADFRRRCLAKMQEFGQGGHTIFFVSHMLQAITQLCQRAILIDGGAIVADGPAKTVVAQYEQSAAGTNANRGWSDAAKAPGTNTIRLRSVQVRTEDGQIADTITPHHALAVEMQYEVMAPDLVVAPSFEFYNQQGTCLFASTNTTVTKRLAHVGCHTTTCWIPPDLLAEGMVRVTALIGTVNPWVPHVREHNAVAFEVKGDGTHAALGPYPGTVRPQLQWVTRVDELDSADVDMRALTQSAPAHRANASA